MVTLPQPSVSPLPSIHCCGFMCEVALPAPAAPGKWHPGFGFGRSIQSVVMFIHTEDPPPFPRLCSSSSCPSSPLSLVSVKFLRGYQITEQSEHGLASVWSSGPLLIVARSSPSMPGRPPELHLSGDRYNVKGIRPMSSLEANAMVTLVYSLAVL